MSFPFEMPTNTNFFGNTWDLGDSASDSDVSDIYAALWDLDDASSNAGTEITMTSSIAADWDSDHDEDEWACGAWDPEFDEFEGSLDGDTYIPEDDDSEEEDNEFNYLFPIEDELGFPKEYLRPLTIGPRPPMPTVKRQGFSYDGRCFHYNGFDRQPIEELRELIVENDEVLWGTKLLEAQLRHFDLFRPEIENQQGMWRLLLWGVIQGKCDKVPERITKLEELLKEDHREATKAHFFKTEKWDRLEHQYDASNLVGAELRAWHDYVSEKSSWQVREWDEWVYQSQVLRMNGFKVDPQFN